MSIQSEITRLNGLKTKIKTALISWGIVSSTAALADCAAAIEGVEVHNNIQAQIQEGDSYTIPRGFHNGSGTVAAVGGGGNYELQSKTVSPSYVTQTVTSDTGFYGLDSVTVNPIPASYKDVSGTTVTPDTVLKGYAFIGADGTEKTGSIENRGKVIATIDGLTTTSYEIPTGFHNGQGTVSLTGDIEEQLAAL